jgi:putative endonuclease
MRQYAVYFMANPFNSVLYNIGVTNNLERRVQEHKTKKIDGFTKKYNCVKLVYYEQTDDISVAISREKQLKNWKRAWKDILVEEENPHWKDLAIDWFWDPETSSG